MSFLDLTGLHRLWEHILAHLAAKVDKVEGKGLSTNDYTTEEKNKLASLEEQSIHVDDDGNGMVIATFTGLDVMDDTFGNVIVE